MIFKVNLLYFLIPLMIFAVLFFVCINCFIAMLILGYEKKEYEMMSSFFHKVMMFGQCLILAYIPGVIFGTLIERYLL